VKSTNAFSVNGFILANGWRVWASRGNCKCFQSSASAKWKRIRLDAKLMESSANIKLLKQGLAYATLYKTLPHRTNCRRKRTRTARKKKLGVFGAEDVGVSKSSAIDNLSALQS